MENQSEQKVIETPVENSFTAESLHGLTAAEIEKKLTTVVPGKPEPEPEEKIVELGEKVEEKPVEEVPVETPVEKPVETPKVEETPKDILSDDVIDKITEKIAKKIGVTKAQEQVQQAKEEVFPKMTKEEMEAEYSATPGEFTQKVLQASIREMSSKLKNDILASINARLDPVASKVEAQEITSRIREVENSVNKEGKPLYPEMKDVKIRATLQKYFDDPLIRPIIERSLKLGKNPYETLIKMYRAENLESYITNAKVDGVKEGEKKVATAKGHFVEVGGKPPVPKKLTVDEFKNLPITEMEKLLRK